MIALFGLLILSRLTGVEVELSGALREAMRSSGEYEGRRWIQGIVASCLIIAFIAVAFGALYRRVRHIRGRRNYAVLAAQACGWMMVMLVALRLVSLHMIDALLYGPLKLNWVVDVGSSLAIMGAALYYVQVVRQRP